MAKKRVPGGDSKKAIPFEDYFTSMLSAITESAFLMTPEGVVLAANRTVAMRLGFKNGDDLQGRNILELHSPEVAEFRREQVYRVVATGEPIQFEDLRSGRHILNSIYPVFDQSGSVSRLAVFGMDITDRKRAEEAQRESEQRFRTLANSGRAMIWTSGLDKKCDYFNQPWLDFTGRSLEQEIGDGWVEGVHPDDLQFCVNTYTRAFDTRKPFSMVYRLRRNDGEFRWILDDCMPRYSTEGVFLGYIGHCLDITERKVAEDALKETLGRLRRLTGSVIQVIVMAVEARDPYTAGHQRRVGDLARSIASEMGIPSQDSEGIRVAGVIHDLGKISIPSEILSKPRKLNDTEFALVKEHPQKGYDILKNVDFDWPVPEMILQHHERLNGSGYPRGLNGEEITQGAKIIAVADVVEAMASHRPYRPTLGLEAALEEISLNRGTLFDTDVVDACLRLFREKGYRLLEG